jgi:2-polyprenyl-6-methoxyphenol hydroxylase-like FAD-dependent oxidoreductase
MAQLEHAVVIVGGGPTGLMLAGELALAKIDVAIVERRASQDLAGLRAGGMHIRTIEMLDQRGIAGRFISQGQVSRVAPFAGGMIDISDLPTRHSYFLGLWQSHIERIMAEWVGELGVPVYRGLEVMGFTQDDEGVSVTLSEGRSMRARYVVGCDGGRSVVRKTAGIDFPGRDPTTSYLIAEIDTAEEPESGFRRGEHGMIAAIGRVPGGPVRAVIVEPRVGKRDAPTLEDIREALIGVYGKDFGLRGADYVSRFTDMTRQAAKYRDRRVLLAGDAAHVHSPVGGQGLNLGVQDAFNLGWKLAQVIRGTSPESLLDTYHAERHPVGARVLRNTLAITALERGDDRVGALREMMGELMRAAGARQQYIAMSSGLDIQYDFGKGHPLLGRRMPDLEVSASDGTRRVFSLLREARPVLLNLGALGSIDIKGWTDRVRLVDAKYDGAWELPAVGDVAAPLAVLIRPDGYVAWVGEGGQQGLCESLTTWFGTDV